MTRRNIVVRSNALSDLSDPDQIHNESESEVKTTRPLI